MRRTVLLLTIALSVALGIELFAQNVKHVTLPTVFLGNSSYKGGAIQREEFNRLLKQGLTCHDSAGYRYKVMHFDFNYAERQLYEDSAGNLQMLTDFKFEYCPGDTITSNVAASIYDRVKAGDTVYFDRVFVSRYLSKNNKSLLDTNVIAAKSMKFFIVK